MKRLHGNLFSKTVFLAAAILLPIFFSVFGCAGVLHTGLPSQVEAYDILTVSKNYPKVPADQLIVYPSQRFAPTRYLILAKLKSGGDSYCPTQDELFRYFQKKAAEFGADAVIVVLVTNQTEGNAVMNVHSGADTDLAMGVSATSYPIHSATSGQPNYKGYALAIRLNP
jgi:hypothetical protein